MVGARCACPISGAKPREVVAPPTPQGAPTIEAIVPATYEMVIDLIIKDLLRLSFSVIFDLFVQKY
jgi:hypothetical protein